MNLGRNRPEPTPTGPNFGVVNGGGTINGPVQAAAFSSNVSQTSHIAPGAIERAQDSLADLRQRLEAIRGQHPEAEQALRAVDAISPRLDSPDRDPGALRFMLETLTTTCAAIPSVVTAAQAAHTAVAALLPPL
ncbi:hypothetical protein AQ490_06445 [Wenjunlia vitaminophila]|uniref:Uncharacterized protein n=1 Tax=Wenjunlia vitaminophila TaxID=76728 RepID=A0A0T6LNT4_WENVI|nr:hypothetical protein [Wenjunlia vitaminophila]KRV47532.1 hypothetical protein AQ490_06445 [Wenjunlia vitaminophila]